MEIKKQLVSSRAKTYGGKNGRKFITVHETANTSKGANAQAHANLQTNGFSASWHWTVDDKQAIQSFPHDVQCWHAGDGRGSGNLNSIGIEICVNSDGDFTKAVENAVALVKKIMQDEGISIENVVQHNHWSGKNCPANLRSGAKGIAWDDFIEMVKGNKVHKPKPQVKSSTSNKQSSSKVNVAVDGKWGQQVTKALQIVLGTPADSKISNQLRNAVTQALYNCVSFGSGGSPMVRALQRKIGAKVDGYLGPETIRKLQAFLGTPVDGKIDRPNSPMVRELQRRLNAGTF